MKIYVYTKDFFKINSDLKKTILSAINIVYIRIKEYEKQGIPFNKIFNDEKLKYDKHGEFFTYKTSSHNVQLRILYTFLNVDGEDVIVLGDFALKKKNDKRYIKSFDKANSWQAREIFRESVAFAE